MVAAAIVGSAVVGAAGSAIAGSDAASATRDATNSTLSQTAALSAPYRALGEAAIPQYEALLGLTPPSSPAPAVGGYAPGTMSALIPGPGGRMIPRLPGGTAAGGSAAGGAPSAPGGTANILTALENTPGYQFALQQGERGIANQASLAGGLSGNTLADLDKFNSGLASTTYQQNVDDLARAVGAGQAAAAGQAETIGSVLPAEGSTLAGIDANTTAGITKAIGNGADQWQTMQALQSLNTQVPGGGGGGTWTDPTSGYTYNMP